jgi:hypothetical protein
MVANPNTEPLFCRFNSGAPRVVGGRRSPRGVTTFQPAGMFAGTPSDVVEVVFERSIVLPSSIDCWLRDCCMAAENCLWGAPRIHGELLKLGIAISERTVSRYLRGRPPTRSQTRRTFFANHFGGQTFVSPLMFATADEGIVVDASDVSILPVPANASCAAFTARASIAGVRCSRRPCRASERTSPSAPFGSAPLGAGQRSARVTTRRAAWHRRDHRDSPPRWAATGPSCSRLRCCTRMPVR